VVDFSLQQDILSDSDRLQEASDEEKRGFSVRDRDAAAHKKR
jgi:hypothetical protein